MKTAIDNNITDIGLQNEVNEQALKGYDACKEAITKLKEVDTRIDTNLNDAEKRLDMLEAIDFEADIKAINQRIDGLTGGHTHWWMGLFK